MKLSEIQVEGQEPLLIVLIRKLLAKGERIWYKGNFSLLQAKGIGKLIVDQPGYLDREEYHGPAYEITMHGGMGPVITPPEAETGWVLVKRAPITSGETEWQLQRVKK